MFEEPGNERVIAGRYRLLSRLGEGGMGTVWRARDEVLHREVAVKEVRAPAGPPDADVRRMYTRLEREAWAAARVAHHNVVTVYDVATDGGRPWIVMELVRGPSLADLLEAEGPLDPRRAARIGAEVLSALRAAHGAGVLHRDVKPANVLLADDGRVVLTDFGIAMVEGDSALTMTGEVIGSPEFLAPERALGRTPGPESDLWALGVLLYAAVEGTSPFRQDTPLNTLRAVVDEEPPPPTRAGALAPVVRGLLRKDPAARLPAERAERELRLVAGGGAPAGPGAPRAGTVPAGPYGPTVAARTRSSASPAPPGPGTATTAGYGPAGRDRRVRAVLVLGLVASALALALAGLTYALLNRSDGGDGAEDPGEGRGPGASAGAPGHAESGDGPGPSASGEGDGDGDGEDEGAGSTPPPQSVRVSVAGAHTEYAGPCPPPRHLAPAFTATFTVGRLPARVGYRWVTEDGAVSDRGWRTLSFPAGGERSRQDTVVVTTDDEDGRFGGAVRVEVRAPVEATSDAVAFTLTCETETETPTGGASPSSSPSASASASASGQAALLRTGR
ncbi:Serine/threonine protein kinase [Streptomyces ambofaciens ATCC 23877]|uniref:non-specific serine/threonine protein kinase n=1 Tax=Streptomyces ambofaciens (strain ATCC 23877 / 3486 / DSM 40053 / JCM 4204 / NBRC 12836 / NRRL B-2516) TaxID=278992 RepID=A0A0K2API5_STRA7|nr:serine/threonine-protein kinase [Streptomyces ambofaciens]AKZ54831.1 Serine/threonine protein kinase [Streptomyces ambofaciens ATCC 23877]